MSVIFLTYFLIRAFVVDPFSCHELKLQNSDLPKTSGIFEIDPSGPNNNKVQQFEIYCDLSSDVGKTK